MRAVRVQGLGFGYGGAPALENVSFEVEKGSMAFVLGQNGAGKSTLLKCILGQLAGRGSVEVNGREVKALSPRELAKEMAYIPQAAEFAFDYSVLETALMGRSAYLPWFAAPGAKEVALAEGALARLGIENLKNKGICGVSGGERQLALIGRALVQGSPVFIMDEPTANLDYGNQLRVLERVKGLCREGFTAVVTTHNPQQALLFGDRVVALKEGRLVADGGPQALDADLIWELYKVRSSVQGRTVIPMDWSAPIKPGPGE